MEMRKTDYGVHSDEKPPPCQNYHSRTTLSPARHGTSISSNLVRTFTHLAILLLDIDVIAL